MKKTWIIGILAVALILTVSGVAMASSAQSCLARRNAPIAPQQTKALTQPLAANASSDNQDDQAIIAPVTAFGYPEITVEAGKPVSINFQVTEADLNSCNNEIIIPDFGLNVKLMPGDNIVTFTPTQTGTFYFSCWMGMIQSKINVVEAGSGETGVQSVDPNTARSGGCSMMGGSSTGRGGCCGK